MRFRLLLAKRVVEDIMMWPLILLGRLIATSRPLKKEYKVFFFFPFYHTGGAEKVHSLIAKAAGGQDSLIYFTKKSHNTSFFQRFKDSSCEIRDISRYTDNKAFYFVNIIFRGIISGYINRQTAPPVVFNGQCNFGYKLSPWISRRIRQVELIHSISNFSYIRMPFLPFISQTVMISTQKIAEHIQLYRKFGVPSRYDGRIRYIPNASEFATIDSSSKDFSSVKVLYSGRATAEKRPHLVVAVAKAIHRQIPSVQFIMAGDDFAELKSVDTDFIAFKGNIDDENELRQLYMDANVVIITSSTEGFPLAVIEGMAYGNAIVATPVGDLPVHIQHEENGFILSSTDETKVVTEAVEFVLRLVNDRNLLRSIASNNIQYAHVNFSFTTFAQAYKKIIFS